MSIGSQEFKGLARGKMKGKMKVKAPKLGHPKSKNKMLIPPPGPSLRSNPAYGM